MGERRQFTRTSRSQARWRIPQCHVSYPPERYAEAMRELDAACARIGRDPRTIRRTHFGPMVIGRTTAEVDRVVGELASRAKLSRDEWRGRVPHRPIGTPGEILEHVRRYADAGATYWAIVFPYGHDREMLRIVAEQVMPRA